MRPCIACGATITGLTVWDEAVGPFCSKGCRDKQSDLGVWIRANAYARRIFEITEGLACGGAQFQESDVARAFVIGYAAGLEAGHVSGRRTVRK
jgi:endogenous inhibitor of DNA gyrase (YacG/DUF329 family)